MVNKINLLFDATSLLEGLKKTSSRSGIYFVAYNILKELLKRNNFNITLYCNTIYLLEEYLKIYFEECNNIEILSDKSDFSNINAFFSPVFEIPEIIRKNQQITTYIILYDIIPLLLLKYHYGEMHWFLKLINSLTKLDYTFSISDCTKKDFFKYSKKLDINKAEIIPLAANNNFFINKDKNMFKNIIEKYNIPNNKRYILSICTLEPRKNLLRAVNSFIKFIVKNKIEDLVYVLGGTHWSGFLDILKNEIPSFELYKDKIIFVGYIDDEDLSVIYSNALWFVFTSEYEGFGLPPLEAMQCGTPIITSNNSSLPEVVGDAGIMIDFDSEEQHIKAYEDYYYNDNLREKNANKGLKRSELFSWEKCVNIITEKIIQVEKKKNNTPKVSIIISIRNIIKLGKKDHFIKLMESIKNQTYKNIESIIIDNNYNDTTIELLKEYEDKGILKYYSIPSKNIYDTFNKGIKKSHGKYITFMNANDFYSDENAIKYSVMKLEEQDAIYSYCNMKLIDANNKENIIISNIDECFSGNLPYYQTLFIKLDIVKKLNGFNVDYDFKSNNDFILRLILSNYKNIHINKELITCKAYIYSNEKYQKFIDISTQNFYNLYGKNNNITRYDCLNLFEYECLNKLSIADNIKLGNKLTIESWRNRFFEKMFDHYQYKINVIEKRKRTLLEYIFSVYTEEKFIVIYLFGIKISIKRKNSYDK